MANYGQSRLVAVNVLGLPGMRYGFRTSIESTSSTKLGHVDAAPGGVPIRGLVLGVNSPKPPRAKKRFASATKNFESSFVDQGAIAAAKADGWVVTPGKVQRGKVSSKFSKLVYVAHKISDAIMDGENESEPGVIIEYGWRMPIAQYNLIGAERAALGIEDVTLDDLGSVIFGANSSKPARASKEVVVNGSPARITTFVAHNKVDSLPVGWG